jgi:hypothetical protein
MKSKKEGGKSQWCRREEYVSTFAIYYVRQLPRQKAFASGKKKIATSAKKQPKNIIIESTAGQRRSTASFLRNPVVGGPG